MRAPQLHLRRTIGRGIEWFLEPLKGPALSKRAVAEFRKRALGIRPVEAAAATSEGKAENASLRSKALLNRDWINANTRLINARLEVRSALEAIEELRKRFPPKEAISRFDPISVFDEIVKRRSPRFEQMYADIRKSREEIDEALAETTACLDKILANASRDLPADALSDEELQERAARLVCGQLAGLTVQTASRVLDEAALLIRQTQTIDGGTVRRAVDRSREGLRR